MLSWAALDSQDGSLTWLAPGTYCKLVALQEFVHEVPTSNMAESGELGFLRGGWPPPE